MTIDELSRVEIVLAGYKINTAEELKDRLHKLDILLSREKLMRIIKPSIMES